MGLEQLIMIEKLKSNKIQEIRKAYNDGNMPKGHKRQEPHKILYSLDFKCPQGPCVKG